jgi:DNA-binding helix-hairpin-helix protein with protein kinase domain
MSHLLDLQGQEAGLGRCLGSGGEGAVYSVPSRPGLVAKIYTRTLDDHMSRKLAAMVQLGTEALASFAAWPQNVLADERTGHVVGFLMPRVEGHREIHTLYGPIDRKNAFPDASWAFLVRAARNVAAAFDVVHQHGHVIGDVNQGNVVVSRKATVQLIDCDSFQITHLGRMYPCRVGVPLFTPPELQGQKLEEVTRTPDHDRFGLAVLIFHLLFMGRHPYAGRHPERAIPVQAAIREGLFAFGWDAARQGWQPPPHSLRLQEASAPVTRLFETAFGRDVAAGGARPTAAEWVQVLDELETGAEMCGEDPRHVYARASGACPWCRIEKEGGPSFFFLTPGAASDAFDLQATWKAIEAVRPPGPALLPGPPPGPKPAGRPLPEEVQTWRSFRLVIGASLVCLCALYLWLGWKMGLLGIVGLLAFRRSRPERAEREERLAALAAGERDRARLESHWEEMCGETRFRACLQELEAAKNALEGVRAQEEGEWRELADRFREVGLEYHLKSFALEFARIPGFGKDELSALELAGLTTAADLQPESLEGIPGLDPTVVKGLLLFKEVAARSYAFDPATGIPERDQKLLAESQTRRRDELIKKLQWGATELTELRRQILATREVLGRAHEDLQRRLAQLRADVAGT